MICRCSTSPRRLVYMLLAVPVGTARRPARPPARVRRPATRSCSSSTPRSCFRAMRHRGRDGRRSSIALGTFYAATDGVLMALASAMLARQLPRHRALAASSRRPASAACSPRSRSVRPGRSSASTPRSSSFAVVLDLAASARRSSSSCAGTEIRLRRPDARSRRISSLRGHRRVLPCRRSGLRGPRRRSRARIASTVGRSTIRAGASLPAGHPRPRASHGPQVLSCSSETRITDKTFGKLAVAPLAHPDARCDRSPASAATASTTPTDAVSA